MRWIERKPNWLKGVNSGAKHEEDHTLERVQEIYGVEYIPLRCPKCGSKKIKCYGTKLPVRYHLCRKCGHHFKSIERNHGI